ncbi:hypothetical protein [Burkholderia sp. 3C]
MADACLSTQFAMFATSAARRFAHLEALFDAVRLHLPEGTYERSLVDMGLGVAGRYAVDMRLAMQREVSDE